MIIENEETFIRQSTPRIQINELCLSVLWQRLQLFTVMLAYWKMKMETVWGSSLCRILIETYVAG